MADCPLTVEKGVIALWGKSVPTAGSGFIKSLQFSPDGVCTLSATENNNAVISLINETDMRSLSYYENEEKLFAEKALTSCRLDKEIPIGEAIYDLKWYPGMQSNNPASKCFISSSRDHPIVLWDAGSDNEKATVRCTYRGYDLADELDSAISLTFNLAGDKIYAGYERMIRCFDVSTPGRSCTQYPTSATKRAAQGQKGLISALAFNPDYSGAYAAGSYAHSVGVYVENMSECALLFGNIDFGVTCMKWSPCGHYLWVGGRNNNHIHCYDIRSTQSIVGSVQRRLSSNQRMTFDLDPWGKYLCTGDQDGQVLFYNASTFQLEHTIPSESSGHSARVGSEYSSCINSVAFHPFSALLGVARGERTFAVEIGASDSDSDNESDKMNINDINDEIESKVESECMVADDEGDNGPGLIELDNTCVRILQLPYTPLVLPVAPANPFNETTETFTDGEVCVVTDDNAVSCESTNVQVEMSVP